jgi:ABC-type nitrate/sulfonate/bicarbonate transport system substrate-binding protein
MTSRSSRIRRLPLLALTCSLVCSTLGVLLVGVSNSSAASKSKNNEVTTLRYEPFPTILNFPELAESLGYLKGLKLDVVGEDQNGPQEIEALAAGDLDFAASFNGGIISAVAAGIKIKSVIDYLGDQGLAAGGIYVPTNSPITSASQLVGKTVAYSPGTLAGATVDTYLLDNGITPSSVTTVSLTGLSEIASLSASTVNAGYLVGTAIAQAQSQTSLRALTSENQLYGLIGTCGIVFTDAFIKANPDTVKTFVAGVAKAIVWAQSHSTQQVINKYVAWLTSQGRTSDATAFAFWKADGLSRKGGVITSEDFRPFATWLQKIGTIQAGQVQLKSVYTNQFNPYFSS